MLSAAIVVVSTKIVEGKQPDEIRSRLEPLLQEHGIAVERYDVVRDEREKIHDHLLDCCDAKPGRLVFTVGGTGVRPTDWVPEVTKAIVEKEIPGIGEVMRAESGRKVRTAMLARGTAGIRGSSLVINLPGSARGAQENLAVVLPLLDHVMSKISSGTDVAV